VPAEYCPDIEAETRERGAPVMCEELRPDVGWTRIRGHLPPAPQAEGPASPGELDDAKGGEAVHATSLGGQGLTRNLSEPEMSE
jgi:DNA-binding transcriptional regulator YdaS (Cro superfamily)